eukprot:gb/GFBE01052563.1/.p1 GENE.gb/GFBE01052563.1/~~gb/GFBE01052563.1/.p1  ORF type:complete len:818 (+),score=194.08 gb/GFBE01052563.1/:1-2454(+)
MASGPWDSQPMSSPGPTPGMMPGAQATWDAPSSPIPQDPYAEVRNFQPPPSKALRGTRLFFAALVTSFLVWAAHSEEWSSFVVKAVPSEVYQMYDALNAMVPGTNKRKVFSKKAQQQLSSKKAVPVFRIRSGLWAASVEGLCRPEEAVFRSFVDEKKCMDKLIHFCEAMLEEVEGNPLHQKVHDACQKRVSKGAVHMNLLLDPPAEETALKEGVEAGVSLNAENLEHEFEVHGSDSDAEFCETVADCKLLDQLQPWRIALACFFLLGLALMVLSTLSFAVAIFSQDPKYTNFGCHAMFVTTLVLAGAIAIDVYSCKAYPIEKLFRTEDLFYFMMPDASDIPPDLDKSSTNAASSSFLEMMQNESFLVHLPAELLSIEEPPAMRAGRMHRRWGSALDLGGTALAEIATHQVLNQSHWAKAFSRREGDNAPLTHVPATKWQGMLMTLTGNLLAALVSKDLSQFFNPLKEAVLRGFSKASTLFEAWFKHLKKALDSPETAANLLNKVIESFVDMSDVTEVCQTAGPKACESLRLSQLKQDARKLFEVLRTPVQELIAKARHLLQLCVRAISGAKSLWNRLKGVTERIVQHVVKVLQKGAGGFEALLSVAQPEVLSDVKALFSMVFKDLPPLVVVIRDLATKFVALLKGVLPVVDKLKAAARQAQDMITKRTTNAAVILEKGAGHMENKYEGVQQQIREKMQKRVNEVSSVWLDGAADNSGGSSSLLEEGLAKASGRTGAGKSLLGMLAGFALGGGMSSPAARIGTVIISEIEHMGHPQRGFDVKDTDPFQHFGWVTFALIAVASVMLLSYALFACGFITS